MLTVRDASALPAPVAAGVAEHPVRARERKAAPARDALVKFMRG
jgi:hypothetical protein